VRAAAFFGTGWSLTDAVRRMPERSEYVMESNGEKNSIGLTTEDTMQIAGILVGGGILGSLYLLVRRSRNFLSWIVPIGLMAAGISLYLKDRQERVEQSGDQIIAQLDELDPITRAEVVRYVAEHEIERIT
jgi:hypothetical protein